jgi:hypothetical protein
MLKLGIGSPFTPEQESLMHVRNFITFDLCSSLIRYEIDILSRKIKSDFCEVECRVIETILVENKWQESRFFDQLGLSPRVGRDMDSLIRAELCGLIQCLNEIGVDVSFDDSNESFVSYIENSWSKRDILSCSDVDSAIKEMDKRGIDTSDVKKYKDSLSEKGERLTKNKLADFVFPNEKVIISRQDKRPAKRVDNQPVVNLESKRSSLEAEQIHSRLRTIGLGEKEFETTMFKQVYSSLILFCFAATDEEIELLINDYKSE